MNLFASFRELSRGILYSCAFPQTWFGLALLEMTRLAQKSKASLQVSPTVFDLLLGSSTLGMSTRYETRALISGFSVGAELRYLITAVSREAAQRFDDKQRSGLHHSTRSVRLRLASALFDLTHFDFCLTALLAAGMDHVRSPLQSPKITRYCLAMIG